MWITYAMSTAYTWQAMSISCPSHEYQIPNNYTHIKRLIVLLGKFLKTKKKIHPEGWIFRATYKRKRGKQHPRLNYTLGCLF